MFGIEKMIEYVQFVRLGNDEFSKFSHPYVWTIQRDEDGYFKYYRRKTSKGGLGEGDNETGSLSSELAVLGALVSNYQVRFYGVHDSPKGIQYNLFRLSSAKRGFFLYKGCIDLKKAFSPLKKPSELIKDKLLTKEELEKIGVEALPKLERLYQSVI